MKSKITVTVNLQEYILITEDDENYVNRIASLVDADMRAMMNGMRLSETQAAVLCAMNMADKAQKNADSADHLRGQLAEYLEETQKLKGELAEARREVQRYRNGGR